MITTSTRSLKVYHYQYIREFRLIVLAAIHNLMPKQTSSLIIANAHSMKIITKIDTEVNEHFQSCYNVAANKFVALGDNSTITIFTLKGAFRQLYTLSHSFQITTLSLVKKENLLVVAGYSSKIVLWDLNDVAQKHEVSIAPFQWAHNLIVLERRNLLALKTHKSVLFVDYITKTLTFMIEDKFEIGNLLLYSEKYDLFIGHHYEYVTEKPEPKLKPVFVNKQISSLEQMSVQKGGPKEMTDRIRPKLEIFTLWRHNQRENVPLKKITLESQFNICFIYDEGGEYFGLFDREHKTILIQSLSDVRKSFKVYFKANRMIDRIQLLQNEHDKVILLARVQRANISIVNIKVKSSIIQQQPQQVNYAIKSSSIPLNPFGELKVSKLK